MKTNFPLFDAENEIQNEPGSIYAFREKDPFLTVGEFFIGLIVAGFVILSLHVVLLREEAKLAEVENSIKN